MKVKVLMYGKIMAASSMLHTGIYETKLPTLYSMDEKIDDLIAQYKAMGYDNKEHFKNLRKCQLVEYELKRVEQ